MTFLIMLKKSAADALKTASKKKKKKKNAQFKSSKSNGRFNWLYYQKVLKSSPKNDLETGNTEDDKEIPKERYISPEKKTASS